MSKNAKSQLMRLHKMFSRVEDVLLEAAAKQLSLEKEAYIVVYGNDFGYIGNYGHLVIDPHDVRCDKYHGNTFDTVDGDLFIDDFFISDVVLGGHFEEYKLMQIDKFTKERESVKSTKEEMRLRRIETLKAELDKLTK